MKVNDRRRSKGSIGLLFQHLEMCPIRALFSTTEKRPRFERFREVAPLKVFFCSPPLRKLCWPSVSLEPTVLMLRNTYAVNELPKSTLFFFHSNICSNLLYRSRFHSTFVNIDNFWKYYKYCQETRGIFEINRRPGNGPCQGHGPSGQ